MTWFECRHDWLSQLGLHSSAQHSIPQIWQGQAPLNAVSFCLLWGSRKNSNSDKGTAAYFFLDFAFCKRNHCFLNQWLLMGENIGLFHSSQEIPCLEPFCRDFFERTWCLWRALNFASYIAFRTTEIQQHNTVRFAVLGAVVKGHRWNSQWKLWMFVFH